MAKSSKAKVLVLPGPCKQIGQFLTKERSEDDEQDDEFDEQQKFSYGLIVGQFPRNEDPLAYIVHFARTPVEVRDDDDESEVIVESFDKVDPEWILEHAKRVSIMLPGGMQVLGVYFADEQSSEKVLKLPVVESSIMKIDNFINPSKKNCHYLAVHFSKTNSSRVCEILSSENGSISKSRKVVDFDETEKDFCWQSIQSKFLFDYPFVFSSEQESSFNQKMQEILGSVEKNLFSSRILIDDEFRSNLDEHLDKNQADGATLTKDSRRRNTSEGGDDVEDLEDDQDDDDEGRCTEHVAQILLDPLYLDNSDEVELLDVSSRMRLSGRMALRAYLHPKATVREAIDSIKDDFMKSLRARCDMHCDSLVAEEDCNTDELPVLHEPPRRVLIKLPQSPVTISDLLFPGESTEASAKAVDEMFGFFPELEDLDDEQELVASPKQVVSGDGDDRSELLDVSPLIQKPTTLQTKFGTASILLSVVAVIVGFVISYLFSTQNDEDDEAQFAETFIPSKDSKQSE